MFHLLPSVILWYDKEDNKTMTEASKTIQELKKLFKGYEIYLVGGAVRDMVLGRETKEYDFCTDATPDIIKEKLSAFGGSTYDIGEKFGTIGCVRGETEIQITTYRAETYDGVSRKPDVQYHGTLKDDLSRRDFTINSMAWDGKKLVDPFGGAEDLKNKTVRFTGEPEQRIMEDPLRMLRAVRFTCELNFIMDEKTLQAVTEYARELSRISMERIAQEMDKILLSVKPSAGLRLLYQTGLYAHFLPLDMLDVEQPKEYHHKNVFEHTMQAVDQSPPDLMTRWALLFHDFGKSKTRKFEAGEVHFIGHEFVSEKVARKVLRKLRYKKQFTDDVCLLVRSHMSMHGYGKDGGEWTDGAVRRLMQKMGNLLPYFMDMVRSDISSRKPERVKQHISRIESLEKRMVEIREQEEIEKIKPLLDGTEIMEMFNISPSRLVGKIKDALFQKQLDLGPAYTKEMAVEDAREIFNKESKGENIK